MITTPNNKITDLKPEEMSDDQLPPVNSSPINDTPGTVSNIPEKNPQKKVEQSIIPDTKRKRGRPRKDKSNPLNIPIPPVSDLALVATRGSGNDVKIQRVFKKTLDYRGDLIRAMREEGYSESYIKQGGNIVRTATWQKLINIYWPVHRLMEIDSELLNHPDWRAKANALDRIYKLRGAFVKRVDVNVRTVDPVRSLKDDELQEIIDGTAEIVTTSDEGEGGEGEEGAVA